MPLIYKIKQDSFQLGVWEITENEDFFVSRLGFCSLHQSVLKKLQYQASRLILLELDSNFNISKIDTWSQDKPLYFQNFFFFNVSHSGNFAAAILSKEKSVGMDIEFISQKIKTIKKRFLNADELELLKTCNGAEETEVISLFWSVKEAVLKWIGISSFDYLNDMSILGFNEANFGIIEVNLRNAHRSFVSVHYMKQGAYWITYCI